MQSWNVAVLAVGIAVGALGATWLAPQPARAAGTAVVYEWKVEGVGTTRAFQEQLNKAAGEGWDLVEVYPGPLGQASVFRRPKP